MKKRKVLLKGFLTALIAAFFTAFNPPVNAATDNIGILSLTPPDPGPGDSVAVEVTYCADAMTKPI